MDTSKNILNSATNLGTQLLQKEIADHGSKQPESRPEQKVIVQMPEQKKMDKKTMIYIGAGVAATALVLVLALKKK